MIHSELFYSLKPMSLTLVAPREKPVLPCQKIVLSLGNCF